jgi:hypothetical protein
MAAWRCPVADVTSFAVDQKSREALEELRITLNASSNAEVIHAPRARTVTSFCERKMALNAK